MLRYDQSVPHENEDWSWIESSPGAGHRSAMLRHVGPDKVWTPTIARWASFGWTVDLHTIRRAFPAEIDTWTRIRTQPGGWAGWVDSIMKN
jgi:hypothetical protein